MTKIRLLFWLATAGYWAVLCVLTHLPPQYLPHVGLDDKVEHLLAYGMLAGMVGLALWVTFPARPWLVWTVLLVGLVYGAVDEQTQPYFGRTCDIDDWIADAVGTMAGLLPVLLLQRFVRLPGDGRDVSVTTPGDLGPDVEAALDLFTADVPAKRSRRSAA